MDEAFEFADRILTQGSTLIYELARPADDNYYQEIVARYPTVHRFFSALLRTVSFASNEAGKPILKALPYPHFTSLITSVLLMASGEDEIVGESRQGMGKNLPL